MCWISSGKHLIVISDLIPCEVLFKYYVLISGVQVRDSTNEKFLWGYSFLIPLLFPNLSKKMQGSQRLYYSYQRRAHTLILKFPYEGHAFVSLNQCLCLDYNCLFVSTIDWAWIQVTYVKHGKFMHAYAVQVLNNDGLFITGIFIFSINVEN